MGLLKKLLLPTLFVLLPTVSLAAQLSFEAKVVKIIDGDTITALDNQNTSVKIRLYGIDAPESKQAFGQKSKQALSSAIAAQNTSKKANISYITIFISNHASCNHFAWSGDRLVKFHVIFICCFIYNIIKPCFLSHLYCPFKTLIYMLINEQVVLPFYD
ncbi:thermonuclease family protein [Escherichia coli]|uniref:thermonuclease family protein n=1 Tax=Escherichia coli TaxID=562 RepID=UPI0006A1242D|nr:hypothetical protein [Escherichia coli]MCF0257799.1 hypothetical protein [Bacteroides heparinolyticus]MCH4619145.1 hypothetical protein [Escherichia coli]MCQ1707231.1 hypothetical protein [Escherichia coli]CTU22603.1 putative nuclease [Escherichia coli]GDG00250.1 endonuclease [Escherichia coli]